MNARLLIAVAPAVLMLVHLVIAPAAGQATTTPTTTATDVEYGRAGDVSLKLDIGAPPGDGPFPCAIIIHGGGWGSGDKQTDITPLFQPLTHAGFIWFSINYRLAPAHRWPACLEDVRTAVRWVKARAGDYKGDPNRVALIGYSAGGQLAFMTALTTPDIRVQAVVGLAPPTDFEQDLPQRGGLSKALQDLLGRPNEVSPESLVVIRGIGPIHHVKPGLPPFLIVHGSADKSVPIEQSIRFREKLRSAGVPCELVTIEGAPHRLAEWSTFDAGYVDRIVGWLRSQLSSSNVGTR
jgi:acetyl esterase/lipase